MVWVWARLRMILELFVLWYRAVLWAYRVLITVE